jgi:hypothetical protein
VLKADTTVWAPAFRTGPGWRDFLTFDFLTPTRLTAVKLTLPASGYRNPNNVSILTSLTGFSWTFLLNQLVPANGEIILPVPTQVSMIRLIIEDADGTADSNPIGVQQVDWKGCYVSSKPVLQTCPNDTTRISTVWSQYRHISYDSVNKILYLCDLSPFKPGRLICYSNKQDTKTFVELPSYVSNIIGFSPSQGKVYFRDKSGVELASVNGQRMELLLNAAASISDLVLPSAVPGISPLAPITLGPYTANFNGILYAGKKIISWGACCTP